MGSRGLEDLGRGGSLTHEQGQVRKPKGHMAKNSPGTSSVNDPREIQEPLRFPTVSQGFQPGVDRWIANPLFPRASSRCWFGEPNRSGGRDMMEARKTLTTQACSRLRNRGHEKRDLRLPDPL